MNFDADQSSDTMKVTLNVEFNDGSVQARLLDLMAEIVKKERS